MEVIATSDEHFTPEQMNAIRHQGKMLGEKTIRKAEHEWPELIAKVRAAMDKSLSPTSDEVRKLAKRWNELVEMFTGGNPGIRESLQKQYDAQPGYAEQQGLDPEIFVYVAKATTEDKDQV